MNAATFEGIGADVAHECLDAILSSDEQASACRAVIAMLDSLSGDGEISKQARRGAAVALVNVIERGLAAVRADGGGK